MGVLNVEDRIVLRRLDYLHEVEIERRIGAASQHHEPDDVLADFVHHPREVTKSPARLDILTGSPPRNSRTMLMIFTSRSTRPSVSALTAACTRLTVRSWSSPNWLERNRVSSTGSHSSL